MPLTCPLLLLFVLKLENRFSQEQELEILYRAGTQKQANTYCFLCFLFFGWNPPPRPPPPHPKKKKSSDLDSLSKLTY